MLLVSFASFFLISLQQDQEALNNQQALKSFAGVGGLVVGIFFGIVLFALIRNRHNFIWSPRNRRGNYAVSYDNGKEPHSNGAAEKLG